MKLKPMRKTTRNIIIMRLYESYLLPSIFKEMEDVFTTKKGVYLTLTPNANSTWPL